MSSTRRGGPWRQRPSPRFPEPLPLRASEGSSLYPEVSSPSGQKPLCHHLIQRHRVPRGLGGRIPVSSQQWTNGISYTGLERGRGKHPAPGPDAGRPEGESLGTGSAPTAAGCQLAPRDADRTSARDGVFLSVPRADLCPQHMPHIVTSILKSQPETHALENCPMSVLACEHPQSTKILILAIPVK